MMFGLKEQQQNANTECPLIHPSMYLAYLYVISMH